MRDKKFVIEMVSYQHHIIFIFKELCLNIYIIAYTIRFVKVWVHNRYLNKKTEISQKFLFKLNMKKFSFEAEMLLRGWDTVRTWFWEKFPNVNSIKLIQYSNQ